MDRDEIRDIPIEVAIAVIGYCFAYDEINNAWFEGRDPSADDTVGVIFESMSDTLYNFKDALYEGIAVAFEEFDKDMDIDEVER